MSAIAASFIGYTVKAVIFAAVAYAGIICGKKFRDSRTEKRIKQQFSQAKLGRCMAELLQNEWRTQLITGGCAGKNNSTEEQKT